ncbi:MAG: SET domain-containing protein-lysine N-methyltransferase [Planctomycetaceae bacterium]|jgi:hypothetical protein|nr:SET domain-containing protein-lysine N-methyltransferase [Planctomycetaceae bacterium]
MVHTSDSETPASETFRRSPSDAGKVFPCGVKIGKTSYGMGVFAFAFIPKGTPIARIAGTVICDPDYGSNYCIDAGDDKVLEPEPPFCYLNHSCEPNCQLTQYVREEETEEDEPLETGEVTEEDMDFETECDECDECGECEECGECFYGSGSAAEAGRPETENETGEPGNVEPHDENGDENSTENEADLWIESLQDILPDEELTIDYAWPADIAVKCLCGKPNCRGWVVDPAELNKIKKRRRSK